jgi:ribosomal protein L1
VEVDHAVAETAFVQELERHANALGKRGLPPPTTMGVTNNWSSSTSPASIACAARLEDLRP